MEERNEMYPCTHNPELVGRLIMEEISRARTWYTIEVGRDALVNMRRISDSIRKEMDYLNSTECEGTTLRKDHEGEEG